MMLIAECLALVLTGAGLVSLLGSLTAPSWITLRPGELPGALCCLLAGKTYRRRLRWALAARAAAARVPAPERALPPFVPAPGAGAAMTLMLSSHTGAYPQDIRQAVALGLASVPEARARLVTADYLQLMIGEDW